MARIIIADDDDLMVELVRSILERDGHIVGSLPDGHSVATVAIHKRPDLIILDCSMPHKSGIDALVELRTSRGGYDIPVLMLTAHRGRTDEEIALQAGADEYMRKPFDPDHLSVMVESMLAKAKAA